MMWRRWSVPAVVAAGAATLAMLGVAALAPTAWAQSGQADVEAACGAATNLPPEICACVAEQAMAELNDTQREWYVAALTGDQGRADALRAEMPVADTIAVATFTRDAPADCARGG